MGQGIVQIRSLKNRNSKVPASMTKDYNNTSRKVDWMKPGNDSARVLRRANYFW